MQGKVLSGKFRQYGRRVSRVRVSVKIRVRFSLYVSGIRRVATALQSKEYENH